MSLIRNVFGVKGSSPVPLYSELINPDCMLIYGAHDSDTHYVRCKLKADVLYN